MKMYWTTFKNCDSSISINYSATVAVDDLIYSFGWEYGSLKPINIHVLNTNTLEWSLLPDPININGERLKPPHVPLNNGCGHTVVAYDKNIYLWGGTGNTLYCFNTKTLNWSRPPVSGIIPSARHSHLACISSHMMYIYGGIDVDMDEYVTDVHCLDLKTMNWSNIITTGEIPSSRKYTTTIVNNRMYINGGLDNIKRTYFADTMYLDLESNRWHNPKTNGNIPIGSLFVHNNTIYILGRYIDRNYRNWNDLYYFDTKRNQWSLIKPPGKSPTQTNAQACIVIGDKMFLLHRTGLGFIGSRISIQVLDFNPSLKTLATMAIVENGLDFSCLPIKLRSEIHSMRQH